MSLGFKNERSHCIILTKRGKDTYLTCDFYMKVIEKKGIFEHVERIPWQKLKVLIDI